VRAQRFVEGGGGKWTPTIRELFAQAVDRLEDDSRSRIQFAAGPGARAVRRLVVFQTAAAERLFPRVRPWPSTTSFFSGQRRDRTIGISA